MNIFANVPHATEVNQLVEDRKYQAFLEDLANALKKNGMVEHEYPKNLTDRFWLDDDTFQTLAQKGYSVCLWNEGDKDPTGDNRFPSHGFTWVRIVPKEKQDKEEQDSLLSKIKVGDWVILDAVHCLKQFKVTRHEGTFLKINPAGNEFVGENVYPGQIKGWFPQLY